MTIEAIMSAITPEIYERLKSAVELGKWEDGTPLTEQQKEHSLQAVIAYQALHLEQTEHMTVAQGGKLNLKSKSELKKQFAQDAAHEIERFKP